MLGGQFADNKGFLNVLLHEMTHSTGPELGRDYEQHAAYLQSWIQALQEDPAELYVAEHRPNRWLARENNLNGLPARRGAMPALVVPALSHLTRISRKVLNAATTAPMTISRIAPLYCSAMVPSRQTDPL